MSKETMALGVWNVLAFFFLTVLKASSASGPFSCMFVRDLDVQLVTIETSRLTKKACAHKCVAMDSACSGFHQKQGLCFLLPPTASWNENRLKAPVEICIKIHRKNPKCTPQHFPHAFGRSRYVFVRQKKTWSDAATHCQNINSKLAQVTSVAEMNAIKILLKKNKAETFSFNGLLQLPEAKDSKDGWVWHRSGDPMIPDFWYTGEPNDYRGRDQNVGAFYRNGQSDDATGSDLRFFVCECFII